MRRLIVCCDGTWNRGDWDGGTATNVVRIARAIKPMGAGTYQGDPDIPQIVYYHQGIGTGNRLDRILGGGVGLGLSQNVRDAYAFLVNNYVPGDEIFLFGFSRGAFTARTLGGLIGSIGLLLRSQMGAFMDAWAYHRLSEDERLRLRVQFADHFPGRFIDPPIQCIAVWDTVGALGVPRNHVTGNWHPCKSQYGFHDTNLGDHVANAFQALAIDEERPPFDPVIWTRSPTARPDQSLCQMWFSGVHSDIGGGFTNHGASDVALLWIASELVERKLLDIDETALASELDNTLPYGAGALHPLKSFLYRRLFGQLFRKVACGPTEYVHATVAQRVTAGLYHDDAFLKRHSSRFKPLSAFEMRLGGYATGPMVLRKPFLREIQTICETFIRWFMGAP